MEKMRHAAMLEGVYRVITGIRTSGTGVATSGYCCVNSSRLIDGVLASRAG